MTRRIIILILTLAASAAAGELQFRAGGRIDAPFAVRGEHVEIDTPDGPFVFPKRDVRILDDTPAPEQDWPRRAEDARRSDADARYQAGLWAIDHGLIAEADAMLRDAHAADPAHRPAARLVAVLDRLAAPCPDPDLDPNRLGLPGRWKVARGPHVLLFHQHDDADAAERVAVLEAVTTAYYLTLAAQGFDLALPAGRLPSAWFARRDDYLAYLRAEHADAFLTTRGYFHPTRHLVVASDARDDLLPRLRPGDDDRRRLLHGQRRRLIDHGTAAHEMVHQLVDASGLAPHRDAFPHWLHEGFAAQFEAVRGGRWAGVGQPHPLRLADWPRRADSARLAPLIEDVGLGRGYRADRYALAWSLVHYLRHERPAEFVTFLDLLRARDLQALRRDDGRSVLPTFRAAFGDDLSPTEAAWLRHAARLRNEGARLATGRPAE